MKKWSAGFRRAWGSAVSGLSAGSGVVSGGESAGKVGGAGGVPMRTAELLATRDGGAAEEESRRFSQATMVNAPRERTAIWTAHGKRLREGFIVTPGPVAAAAALESR
jgi:hypothetical protein